MDIHTLANIHRWNARHAIIPKATLHEHCKLLFINYKSQIMSIKGTETENLLKSFAGESQARSRYTFLQNKLKRRL